MDASREIESLNFPVSQFRNIIQQTVETNSGNNVQI